MARFLPNPPRSRVAQAAGLLVLALAALPACKETPQPAGPPKATTAAASESPHVETRPAVSLAPLGRTDILKAAAAAADAVADGRPLPSASLDVTDQTFELRLPFGCNAATRSDWWEWSFDPGTNVLRVAVKPQRWSNDPRIAALAKGMPFEAAEGFWIERSWTSSEECPPPVAPLTDEPGANASDSPAPVPGANIAIAQFFGPGTPRTAQRGNRPYTYTGKQGAGVMPAQRGFRLRVSGRISGFPDGQPFHCAVVNPATPPICVLAVQITGVALELPGVKETLAEWTY